MFGARKNLKNVVENSFGKNPMEGFSFYNAKDRLENVRRLHNELTDPGKEGWIVDEVTWNDLEMDQIFLRINHTNSFIGEQVLYHKLHMLSDVKDDKRYDKLRKKLDYLEENPKTRSEIEANLHGIEKFENAYLLPEFVMNAKLWTIGNSGIYHVLQMFLILFLVLGCVVNEYFFIGLLIVGSINLVIYMSIKQKYDVYFSSLIEFKKIYEFCRWIQKYDKDKMFVSKQMQSSVEKLKSMSRIIVKVSGRHQMSMAGGLVAIINEYLWGILLVDVSVFNYIMKVISKNQKEVMELLLFVGEVDADIAIVSYRKSISKWCEPVFVCSKNGGTGNREIYNGETNNVGIEYIGVAHPLLNNPVRNDFIMENRAVITGTNASGKSTFMKSVAINMILAETINTCVADEAKLCPMPVVSCMALRDDILTGESYYFREAKCIKRILDMTEKEEPILIIIDEILKGTNTSERVAASKAILEYLATTHAITIVATHDNELTKSEQYENYHFKSLVKDNDIVFDYRIHKGTCESTNAIELLAYMNYPKKVIERAKCYLNENW